MIFRQHEKVMSGEKSQTRRLVKESHSTIMINKDYIAVVRTNYFQGGYPRSRCLWSINNTYAVQPPGEPGTNQRGGKSIGRILIKSIRRESLQDISNDDLIKEGFVCYEDFGGAVLDELQPNREGFIENWDDMYCDEPNFQWDKNPMVYVIDFEKV